MNSARHIRITVPAALRLIDLIEEMVRETENVSVKRILLRAGIKIADLALAGETATRRSRRAA